MACHDMTPVPERQASPSRQLGDQSAFRKLFGRPFEGILVAEYRHGHRDLGFGEDTRNRESATPVSLRIRLRLRATAKVVPLKAPSRGRSEGNGIYLCVTFTVMVEQHHFAILEVHKRTSSRRRQRNRDGSPNDDG